MAVQARGIWWDDYIILYLSDKQSKSGKVQDPKTWIRKMRVNVYFVVFTLLIVQVQR